MGGKKRRSAKKKAAVDEELPPKAKVVHMSSGSDVAPAPSRALNRRWTEKPTARKVDDDYDVGGSSDSEATRQEREEMERRAREEAERERRAREEAERARQRALEEQLERERREREEREERERREREEVERFRMLEEEKRRSMLSQEEKSSALAAARERMVASRRARAEEESRRIEEVTRAAEAKKQEDQRRKEEAQQKVMSDLQAMEASLQAEEARLREIQETESLRREMEARSAQQYGQKRPRPAPSQQQQQVQQQQQQQHHHQQQQLQSGRPFSSGSAGASGRGGVVSEPTRKRRVVLPANASLEDKVEAVYLQRTKPADARLPRVPLVFVKQGLYRFGTRNVRVRDDDGVDGGVSVVQSGRITPLLDYIEGCERTEALRLRGLSALSGIVY